MRYAGTAGRGGRRHKMETEQQLFTGRALRALIIPLILEQILGLTVGMADSIMVSSAGEAADRGFVSGFRGKRLCWRKRLLFSIPRSSMRLSVFRPLSQPPLIKIKYPLFSELSYLPGIPQQPMPR